MSQKNEQTSGMSITYNDIKGICGSVVIGRSKSYIHSPDMQNFFKEGSILRATCSGSIGKYRIWATLEQNSIVLYDCSCPAMRNFGPCKHLAAMLAMWIETPEIFQERQTFEMLLQKKKKDELRDLVLKIAKKGHWIEEQIYKWLKPRKKRGRKKKVLKKSVSL